MQRHKPDDALIRSSNSGLAGEDRLAIGTGGAAGEAGIIGPGVQAGIARRSNARGPTVASASLSGTPCRRGGVGKPADAIAPQAEDLNVPNNWLPLKPANPDAVAFRRDHGVALGVVANFAALAIVAATTTVVFFGIAFVQLRPPAASAFGQPLLRSTIVAAVPSAGLSRRGAVAKADRLPPKLAEPVATRDFGGGAATPPPTAKRAGFTADAAAAGATVADGRGAEPQALAQTIQNQRPNDQVAGLLARGDAFLRAGDIASARLFYERAANGGDGQAALRAGVTFDPAFLASTGLRMRGDPARAVDWYRRALALGASNAEPYLHRLESK